jgi:flagellar biosynthesis protein FlhF
MTTQVFRGKTLSDARERAFQALGKGAVILTTRDVKRGMFGGRDVEIAAAAMGSDLPAPASMRPFASGAYGEASSRRGSKPEERDMVAALRAEVRCEIRALKFAVAKTPPPPEPLMSELGAIREALDHLAPARRPDSIARVITARGIEGPASLALARAMRAMPESVGSPGDRLRASFTQLVEVAPWPLEGKRRTVLAIVGPTGVGKTTTIAKLATLAKMEGKTVLLVTCDTFRVGGVEQIRRYAQLLEVRHEVARDLRALTTAIAASTADVTLVDTSGRPPGVESAESLLAPEAFASLDDARRTSRQVLLCLPASVRWVDAARAARAYALVKPTAVAVTKTDETDAPAGLVHAVLASRLPLSVLCTGPRVPEDIEAATSAGVIERVLGKPGSKGDVR